MSSPTIPPSSIQDTTGSVNSCDCLTPLGQPIVDSDGTVNVLYEMRDISEFNRGSGPPSIGSELWLLKITLDGTTSSTQVSSSDSADLFPGNIIPDGQGGILATWGVVPIDITAPPVPSPYQAADVLGGSATPFNMPMAPTQITNDPNSGLPSFYPLVLGENGIAFISYGSNITSFNLNTGAGNWNYQSPSQASLALISYSNGGDFVAKSTTNGIDTVLRFDSSGNATADAWTGSDVDYWADKSSWIGALPSAVVGEISAQSVDPTPSLSPTPTQERTNRAFSISVKLNFSGLKTRGDKLSFLAPTVVGGVIDCKEVLGPVDCSGNPASLSDRWALNFEGVGSVYDDASNWSIAQYRSAVHDSGHFTNRDNGLVSYSCVDPPSGNNNASIPDGPNGGWTQNIAGQKSIFYLDAPGPSTHVANSNGCAAGFQPIDSMIEWVTFKVTFTNTTTNYSRTLYFYMKLVVDPGRQLNITSSLGKYGSLP